MLVVEDQPSGLLTLLAHTAVSDLGGMREPIHVTTAADAEEGIRARRAAPYQCVVADLGRTDAVAFAFLERLQESPDLRDVPVLAYAGDRPDGARAGDDPDIVLMDLMMPELDGYAAMSMLRQIPAFAALPIIAVTARAMPGDRDKSVAAGASDYVSKPVDTDELLACMERWIGDR